MLSVFPAMFQEKESNVWINTPVSPFKSVILCKRAKYSQHEHIKNLENILHISTRQGQDP